MATIRPSRRLLCLISLAAVAWWPTHSGATTLELSADSFQYFCREQDGPGIVTIHVVMEFNSWSMASRFRIQQSPEVTWTYLSETPAFPTVLGNTQTGITICYDECFEGSALLISIQYMAYGTSAECNGGLSIVPYPGAETVEVKNCDGSVSAAFTRPLTVGGCSCLGARVYPGVPQVFDCTPLATKTTTWGAVKALYRD